MRYKIYDKSGGLINTIVTGEEFCKSYCAANDYTYEEEILPTPEITEETATEETEPEPTEIERLRADLDYIAVMTGVEL